MSESDLTHELYGISDSSHSKSRIMKHLASDETLILENDLPINGRHKFKVRKMYFAALASLVMAVAMGMATGFSAPATYDMKTDPHSKIKPSLNQITWVGSILALGAMFGGLFAGPVTDRLGRHQSLILNTVPFVIGWGLIFYADSFPYILIGRFLCGISCGVISVTVPMYTVEISTPEIRGLLGSSFQGFLVIGNLISMISGYYLSWTWLAYCGACFVVAGMVVLVPMPESPRWLISQDKVREAVHATDFLQGDYLDSVEECRIIHEDLQNQPDKTLSFGELRQPSIFKPALLSFSLMFFQQCSGANAVFFYSTSIFEISEGFMNPKTATIVLAVVQMVATLLSNGLVDKTGRRILLLISGCFMGVSLISLGIFYYISLNNDAFKVNFAWLPLSCLILFTVAFSIGYGPIPWLMVAEMVPVRARSIVSGFATFTNGMFAFIVTKTFAQLGDAIGSHGTFWTYSAISIISCIFVGLLLPETKGKRLEDMTHIFSNKEIPPKNSSVYVINVNNT